MCNIARLDRFCEQWPRAEFGPGHIVLSDANIEDDSIDWCLQILDALLDGGPWPVDFPPTVQWNDHERAEFEATRDFLREFRRLPEALRVEAGDILCDTFPEAD